MKVASRITARIYDDYFCDTKIEDVELYLFNDYNDEYHFGVEHRGKIIEIPANEIYILLNKINNEMEKKNVK